MKKIVLGLLVSIFLISCKEVKKPTQEASARATDCITLEEYDLLNTPEERSEWLEMNGNKVCKDVLFKAIIEDHTIAEDSIESMSNKSFKITWGELDKFLGTMLYDEYLSFEFDANKDIKNIIKVDDFTLEVPCFSAPFFRSIAEKDGLEPDSVIEFKRAVKTNKMPIILVITNGKSIRGFYDYSNEPKLNDPL